MELVVDSNIIISAMISDSRTREILLNSNHRFYAPEFLKSEILKYEDLIVEKSGIEKREFETLLNLVLEEVEILPIESYNHKLDKAEQFIGDEDIKDIPFLAVALAKECKIWSDDKDLKQQNKIQIKTTEQLVTKYESS